MEVRVADVEGIHVVTVEGELTNLTAIRFFNAVVGVRTRAGARIVVDLHAVTYLDSMGAGQLWKTVEAAREGGGRAVLAAAPPIVRKVLDLVGIAGEGVMAGTVEEAVGLLKG